MSKFKLKLSISWLDNDLIENTIRVSGVYDLLNLKYALWGVLTDNLDSLTKQEGWPGED